MENQNNSNIGSNVLLCFVVVLLGVLAVLAFGGGNAKGDHGGRWHRFGYCEPVRFERYYVPVQFNFHRRFFR